MKRVALFLAANLVVVPVRASLERRNGLRPRPLPDKMAAFGISGGVAAGHKRLLIRHTPMEERIAALKASGAR